MVVDWSRVRESVVLCPGATIEDFPRRLEDSDARGLLAAVTIAFHPQVLAQTEVLPVFGRADSPPSANSDVLVWLPSLCVAKLPESFLNRAKDNAMPVIGGGNRSEFHTAAGLVDPPDLCHPDRTISVLDFYAAGFTFLQIQIMTRRLRYTTNLDEVHLQNRLITAAKIFCDLPQRESQSNELVSALHDFFDALASERDHYFATDPHLVDLTLVAASTLDRIESGSDQHSVPKNLLFDPVAAKLLAAASDKKSESLRQRIVSGDFGIAGGGPQGDVRFDLLSFDDAERVLAETQANLARDLGITPTVYGRMDGVTPKDLYGTLVKLGYQGVIPIDFAGGTGFGEESKVILSTDEGNVEALTSRPIDAASDSEFLEFAARLGTAIDRGEIATGLLVHFPGSGCDSYHDLCRATSWGLAIGKFWKLDEYFQDGERPYHHGDGGVFGDNRHDFLDSPDLQVDDPIAVIAEPFRNSIRARTEKRAIAIAALVKGQMPSGDNVSLALTSAVGASSADSPSAILAFNPDSVGRRRTVSLNGPLPTAADHIFAANVRSSKQSSSSQTNGGDVQVTIDVPSGGFVVVQPGDGSASKSRGGLFQSVTRWVTGRSSLIATENSLHNEFLEVTLDSKSGGIAGVFSGAQRGNRLSLRMVGEGSLASASMLSHTRSIVEAGSDIGKIRVAGDLRDASENIIANYDFTYSLSRGSRCVTVKGEVNCKKTQASVSADDYLAMRIAMPDSSASLRWIIRDKLHRIDKRRVVAPAGYLIDQGSNEVLVATCGDPLHRRVGERFVDTILVAGFGNKHSFEYRLGFDCPDPVAMALDAISPPIDLMIQPNKALPDIGYLCHVTGKDVTVLSLDVDRETEGPLIEATVRLLQTRAQATKAALRFCHDVVSAEWVSGKKTSAASTTSDSPNALPIENDAVIVKLGPHAIATLKVKLKP